MERNLTFKITAEYGGFTAQCLELDVVSDGDTAAEAEANLREALDLYFSDPENLIDDE